ncbi:MAG: hypothetical protein RH917_08425 [Lacipirellulaceae bacterium]
MRLKFMHDSSTSERITAIVSTLFAIGILGVAVTAQRVNEAPIGDLAQLESELMTQFDIAYRHDTRLLDKRVAQFNEVLRQWDAAPATDERDEKLARWIREAMARSMPGSKRALPETPEFTSTANPQANEETREKGRLATGSSLAGGLADIIVPFENQPKTRKNSSFSRTPDLAEPAPANTFEEEGVDVEYVAAREWGEEASVAEVFQEPFEEEPIAGDFAGQPLRKVEPLQEESQFAQQPREETPDVKINLRELSARITGYHEGIREIEASLINAAAGDAGSLIELVESLEQLESQRQLVSLYYDLLTERQRRFLREPRSLDTLVARVQTQLDNAERNHEGDFLKPFDRAAQRRLEQLRQRLNLLANQ